ncbi:14 kDa phosphohistidine phosphatase-like [Haliotis rubra]|uniref:14 kDa phosphohistidine phosphatase-like n=1 Tax=Haliotis rubra TaxID=36100 RepID=UPI001EE61184|nr:14 kDa phosphohistidine phosphatase-like [Haliotis rubra]
MPGKTLPVNPKLAGVPDVEIGDTGVFKYILCKIYEGANTSDFKYIVRGVPSAEFHADIYDVLDAKLESEGIMCECVGGGKIEHDPDAKTIRIFGKSQGYGQANHEKSMQILRDKFPAYHSVMWTND